MKTNRFVSVVLVIALLLSALTACGASQASDNLESSASALDSTTEPAEAEDAPPETAEPPQAEADSTQDDEMSALQSDAAEPEAEQLEEESAPDLYPFSDEKMELSLLINVGDFMFPYMEDGDMAVIPSIAAAEEATNIHINFNSVYESSYQEKFQIIMAANEYYDIISKLDNLYPGGMEAALEEGVAMDIAPYLADYAPAYLAYLDDHEATKKLISSDSGAIVGFYQMETGVTIGPAIRGDWLDALGLEIPTTYDDLHSVLTAFKDEYGADNALMLSQYGFADLYASNFYTDGFVIKGMTENEMGWFVDDAGNVQCSEIHDNMKDYILTMRQWIEDGLTSMDTINLTGTDASVLYQNGRTGTKCFQLSELGMSATRSYDENMYWYPIPDPVKNTGDTLGIGKVFGTADTANGLCISGNSNYPEAATAYLNWYFTEEGQHVYNWGTEGQAFEYDENGKEYFTDLILNNQNEPLPSFLLLAVYTSWIDWPGVIHTDRNSAQYSDEYQAKAFDVWSSNKTEKNIYYGTLSVEESEEYNSLYSDVRSYCEENILKFLNGDRSISEWEDYVSQVKAMGIDEMIALKQAAYDRFNNR